MTDAPPCPPAAEPPQYWRNRRVVVTGGASFIGSHLVDGLVALGAHVAVLDDLSSGRIGNIARHVTSGAVEFHQADLRRDGAAEQAFDGADTVFHLAAAHGGRGYIETHQTACAENILLDTRVFGTAARRGVRKLVFASSACVYPVAFQRDPLRPCRLQEEMVGPPYEPDGMYGWAKLTGELALRALHEERGGASVSCRYFGVYGPRAGATHALIAMMARSLLHEDPMRVWGDGTQVRSWCFVEDAVRATLAAARLIDDAGAVNIGSPEAMSVAAAARMVMEIAGHRAELAFEPDMPTGPMGRWGDFAKAESVLGWSPRVPFGRGLRRTFNWYRRTVTAPKLAEDLDELLYERDVQVL